MTTATQFKIGDPVIIKKGKRGPYKVIGLRASGSDFRPECTVFIDSDSPWFAMNPNELKKLTEEEFTKIRRERGTVK